MRRAGISGAALAACLLAGLATADDAIEIVAPRPLQVVVDKSSSELVAGQDVAVSSDLPEWVRSEPLDWNPEEFLDSAGLKSVAGSETLTIGKTVQSPVSLEWSRARLTEGEPGRIALRVNQPQALQPGVYRGRISSRLKSSAVDQELKVHWPVELIVPGRRILEIAFDRVRSGQVLRMGQSAAWTVQIETVNCDLGEGLGQVDCQAAGQNEPVIWRCPLPLREPIDPQDLLATHGKAVIPGDWSDSAILAPVGSKELSSAESDGVSHVVHTISVQLPDCFQTGSLQASVTWPQVESAMNPAELKISTQRLTVEPGIRVFPTLCSRGEKVQVWVETSAPLPDESRLEVFGPRIGKEPKLVLLRPLVRREVKSAPRYRFLGDFRVDLYGEYQVGWPKKNAVLEAALKEPARLSVAYELDPSRLRPAIRIFSGPPPFWWALNGSSTRGSQETETRLDALVLNLDQSRWKSASLSKLSVQQMSSRRNAYGPPDLQQTPQVTFARQEVAAGTLPWVIDASGRLRISAEATILPLKPANAPRFQSRDHSLAVRGHLIGVDSRGRPVSRIFRVPFKVSVSHAWDYYRDLLLMVGVPVLSVLGLILLMRRKPRNRRRQAEPDETESEPAPPDPYSPKHAGADPVVEVSEPATPAPEPDDEPIDSRYLARDGSDDPE